MVYEGLDSIVVKIARGLILVWPDNVGTGLIWSWHVVPVSLLMICGVGYGENPLL